MGVGTRKERKERVKSTALTGEKGTKSQMSKGFVSTLACGVREIRGFICWIVSHI